MLSFEFCNGIEQFLIPVFAKASDKRVTQKLVQRQILSDPFDDGHFTNSPTVVVQANHSATESLLTYGIKRTTNRLAETGLTCSVSLFQGTEATVLDARQFTIISEHTIFSSYDARHEISLLVSISHTLFVNDRLR